MVNSSNTHLRLTNTAHTITTKNFNLKEVLIEFIKPISSLKYIHTWKAPESVGPPEFQQIWI